MSGGIFPAGTADEETAFERTVFWSGPVDDTTGDASYARSDLLDLRLACWTPAS